MLTKFDGFSEFISRRGRMKLLEMLIGELGSRSEVSKVLQISKSTLSGWMNERSRHPSNSSMDRVFDVAWKINPEKTQNILNEELKAFRNAINSFVRRGANYSISFKIGFDGEVRGGANGR